MADYLKRALGELESRDPNWKARGGLVKALAARRSAGNVISELTAGQAGGSMMDTTDPLDYLTSEIGRDQNRVLQRTALQRQAERDAMADMRWAYDYDQKDRIAAARAAGSTKPGTKEMQNIRANTEAINRLNRIQGNIAGLSPKSANKFDSPWYELISGATLSEGLKRRADENYYPPEVELLLSEGKQWESFVRRAFSGTAVTKYEGSNTDSWSPFAAGLSAAQRQQRMASVEQDLLETRGILREQYGDYVPASPEPTPVTPASTGKYKIISVQ